MYSRRSNHPKFDKRRFTRSPKVAAILLGFGFTLWIGTMTSYSQIPPPQTILDKTGIVAPDASVEKSSDGYAFTEGPTADANGNVFFTDQPNDRILRWDAKTAQTTDWLKPAGRSNGMFFDHRGDLWSCADGKNELWKIAPDRSVSVVLRDVNGRLFNGPNDVWVMPDGSGCYFTDPYYHRDYWERGDRDASESPQVLYWLPAGATEPIIADDQLVQPNGLVGTPDGKTLYVADIGDKKTYRYRINHDGTLGERTLFCEMGSDGMTIDELGNVYLTGPGVVVFNSDGRKIAHIPIPNESWTANVCFGGTDFKTLFVTASHGAYTLRMNVAGIRPSNP